MRNQVSELTAVNLPIIRSSSMSALLTSIINYARVFCEVCVAQADRHACVRSVAFAPTKRKLTGLSIGKRQENGYVSSSAVSCI